MKSSLLKWAKMAREEAELEFQGHSLPANIEIAPENNKYNEQCFGKAGARRTPVARYGENYTCPRAVSKRVQSWDGLANFLEALAATISATRS